MALHGLYGALGFRIARRETSETADYAAPEDLLEPLVAQALLFDCLFIYSYLFRILVYPNSDAKDNHTWPIRALSELLASQ